MDASHVWSIIAKVNAAVEQTRKTYSGGGELGWVSSGVQKLYFLVQGSPEKLDFGKL